MYFAMYLMATFITYVVVFKGDFKKESLEKAAPFITVIILLMVLSALFSSLSAM